MGAEEADADVEADAGPDALEAAEAEEPGAGVELPPMLALALRQAELELG